MKLLSTARSGIAALALVAGAIPAAATFPERLITVIVPYAAGGPGDTVVRIVGDGEIVLRGGAVGEIDVLTAREVESIPDRERSARELAIGRWIAVRSDLEDAQPRLEVGAGIFLEEEPAVLVHRMLAGREKALLGGEE